MIQYVQRAWRAIFGNVSGTANPQEWFVEWVRGNPSDSGVSVTPKSAIGYAPLWSGVNKIAGHVGQLPLVVMQAISEREKVRAKTHPAYHVLKRQPNELMGPMVFKELLQSHALLWGNGRAYIDRNANGQPSSLIPLPPETQTIRVLADGRSAGPQLVGKFHFYRDPETHREWVLPDRDVFHVIGLGYDGLQGYSLVEVARNSIGLGLAAEKTSNVLFRNNGVPSLVIEAPRGAFKDKKDAQEFLDKWNQYHGGLDNQQKTALMRDGMKAHVLGMPGKDAEWIEQRKFQRQEAALWLLLESILGDDSSVSYNSLEQKSLAYLVNCLMRWLVKWEEEANKKLLTAAQHRSESHFCKFVTAALLRGTTKERYEVYQIGRMIGVMSANDVRELEDMPPIEGGDEYTNPATTSAPPPETGGDGEEDETADDTEARIRALYRYERDMILQAAGRKGNFIKWLDGFYSSHLATCLGLYLQLGGTEVDAREHVELSKSIVLEAAGAATADNLVATLAQIVNRWPEERLVSLSRELIAA